MSESVVAPTLHVLLSKLFYFSIHPFISVFIVPFSLFSFLHGLGLTAKVSSYRCLFLCPPPPSSSSSSSCLSLLPLPIYPSLHLSLLLSLCFSEWLLLTFKVFFTRTLLACENMFLSQIYLPNSRGTVERKKKFHINTHRFSSCRLHCISPVK